MLRKVEYTFICRALLLVCTCSAAGTLCYAKKALEIVGQYGHHVGYVRASSIFCSV